jgi:large subunit ribosomal protein L1
MGAKKKVSMSQDQAEIKHVEEQPIEENEQPTAEKKEGEAQETPVAVHSKHFRSKQYKAVRSKIDRTKTYDPFAAIELVKKLSYSKFDGTINVDLTVREVGLNKEITFPHSTGKKRVVEIATEKTLAKIEAGNIDFDVLLATPQMMAKLTKYARVLGPKGLMPNPKNGTLTTNPEQRATELQGGIQTLKTEKKAPVIHATIGKTNMDTQELVENLKALLAAFKTRVVKVTVSATMSPGVKVEFEEK